MALAPGTALGPYEILSPLGAGGMGEVFRARDTRLGRDVAVRVLPGHLASDRRPFTASRRMRRPSPPSGPEAEELGSKVGVCLPKGGPGRLDQGGLEPASTLA